MGVPEAIRKWENDDGPVLRLAFLVFGAVLDLVRQVNKGFMQVN
ncbi:hypothetical protein [Neobacillus niacini]